MNRRFVITAGVGDRGAKEFAVVIADGEDAVTVPPQQADELVAVVPA